MRAASREVYGFEPRGRRRSFISRKRYSRTVTKRVISAASRRIAATLLGTPAGLSAYEFLLGPHRVQLTRLVQPVSGLSSSLNGLRIVHLTDIHHSPWQPRDFLQALVERVNLLHPDLVVLTGDYVSNSPRYIAPVARILSGLRCRAGIVGVLGNHDWYEGADLTRLEFAARNISLIDNARVFLSDSGQITRTQSSAALCVAGLGDLWQDHVDIPRALGGVDEQMPRLLLAHNPDCAEHHQLRGGHYRVDLMLCGHTHGGQVRLPLIGSPHVPSQYGQKYNAGLVEQNGWPIYVSRGIGTSGLPVRLGAPAEIAVVELCRA